MPRRIKSERFADLADELLFPRLTDAKLERLAEAGERHRYEPGDVVWEQGERDVPLVAIEHGLVDLIDRMPRKEVWFSRADAGTFVGDIACFTGEPANNACIAAEPTDAIVFSRVRLRELLVGWPAFAEIVLRTLLARRDWSQGQGHGVLRLLASRGSRRAFEVRDLIERNMVPLRWYDVDSDPDSAKLLEWLGITREETPVLVRNDDVLRNPSAAQVARTLGLRAEVDGQRFDMVVLGGGPAGLAAAVYGASEGLRTFVAESWAPGGQAGTSTLIENYLGFPSGISGAALTRNATLQARRFDAVLSSFHRAVELVDGPDGLVRVDLDDGQHVLARTVVMATGARWRRHTASGIDRFTGAGVYHAATPTEAARCDGEDVVVVGGANSAGQAAVYLSQRARSVRVVVRRDGLAATMSRYLLDRIERSPKIEVVTETELVSVLGEDGVEAVELRDRRDGSVARVPASAVFVMIGAEPCTEAANGALGLDAAGYVLCGGGASGPPPAIGAGARRWPLSDRDPHLLETVWPGVFAAGDVRAGATKRVAGAVGDGALAVRFAHAVLGGA